MPVMGVIHAAGKMLLIAGLLVPGARRAAALAVADEAAAAAPPAREPSGVYDLDWRHVVQLKEGSTGVAVGAHWVLTAAHLLGNTGALSRAHFSKQGKTYAARQIIHHRPEDDPNPRNTARADLALVRYDDALPGFYEIAAQGPTRPGELVVMVGYGNTGAVQRVISGRDYYTDSGSGRGTRRWGTGRIERLLTVAGPRAGTTNRVYRHVFSLDASRYAAGPNDKDSGGGTFVKTRSGQWLLTGLIFARHDPSTPGHFEEFFALCLPEYRAWILRTQATRR